LKSPRAEEDAGDYLQEQLTGSNSGNPRGNSKICWQLRIRHPRGVADSQLRQTARISFPRTLICLFLDERGRGRPRQDPRIKIAATSSGWGVNVDGHGMVSAPQWSTLPGHPTPVRRGDRGGKS